MDIVEESSKSVGKENVTIAEKSITSQPLEHQKKNKKEDRASREDKNVEQFMKSLNSVPSVDDKLALVCKKYVQTADENRKVQVYMKQSDKRYAILLKEKEQVQHEYNKTILAKSKLENLCRALQKHNKAIKEESLLKIKEEEERRKETQAKFQSTLSEITALLQQNNEKNTKLRDDNISMTEKFKSVVLQHQLREEQVEKMSKQMCLENQLADAKLQKAALEHQAERERLFAELEQMKLVIAQSKAKNMELQETELALKKQLTAYSSKYDEFQNALVKSSQVFGRFKEQMETMVKKIHKLEKESLSWKNRWELSQKALLEMCGEIQSRDDKVATSGRHLTQMQSLCRALQGERTVLMNTLKENNIECPAMPAPLPATLPPINSASDDKVDAMAANCVQLKERLAELQSQFNTLTNKRDEKEETPKPETKKKSKSKKKNKAQDKPEAVLEQVDESKVVADGDDKSRNDSPDEKIDSEMVRLLQAINIANVNLCELEVVEDVSNENVVRDVASTISNVASELPDKNTLNLEAVEDKLNLVSTVTNGEVSKLDEAILNSVVNETNDSKSVEQDILNAVVNETIDNKLVEQDILNAVINETIDNKLVEQDILNAVVNETIDNKSVEQDILNAVVNETNDNKSVEQDILNAVDVQNVVDESKVAATSSSSKDTTNES